MKKTINFIKQRIDWILIIVGSCMMVYGIFDFEIEGGEPLRLLSGTGKTVHAYGYFYLPNTTTTIALGVALLVLGILIYKEKAKK